MINSTLCYIEKDGCYLMLFRNKKENDPCEGKWVGIGGKFEPGEVADACLKREVWEETGLTLTEYQFHGVIHFVSDVLPDEDMYLYTASGYDGADPVGNTTGQAAAGTATSVAFDCNEGDLRWIPKEQVTGLNLWEGDKFFLEPLIAGVDHIEMTCVYEGDHLVEVR